MGAKSKKKGKRGESELVKILNSNFGENLFRRTPFSGAFVGGKNREISENLDHKEGYVSDIITPADFNFIIEHKFYNSMNFWDLFSEKSNWNDWKRQAEGDAEFVQKQPLIVIKYNQHKRIALIKENYLEWFVRVKTDGFEEAAQSVADMILHNHAFKWKKYLVVWLEDLLKLPKKFWFSKDD